MRYGIFSDVHSNLEAFEVAINFYKTEKIDRFIFLGDIVGYGANPNECILALKSLNPVVIAGNHDWAVSDKFSIAYFNPYAKEAVLWTAKELKQENIHYLRNLVLTYEEKDFICVHGSLENPQQFNYILNSYDAQFNFSLLKQRLCFIGHSHRAEVYILENNQLLRLCQQKIKLNSGAKYIINVGSVGQPRDRDPRLSLCIYDNEAKVVNFVRLEYNIKKAADKILKKGLPPLLAQRLYGGW